MTAGSTKGAGKLLEIVGERQQIAAGYRWCVLRMNAGPERGVGGIFASHGVVTDELDGERVVVDEQLGRNGEIGFGGMAVGGMDRRPCAGSGLDGGEERSVQAEFEMAELRKQAGRKRVEDMNLRGANDMRLRQREVDVVRGVDVVQLDLRRAGVGEGEGVVILACWDSGKRNGFAEPAELSAPALAVEDAAEGRAGAELAGAVEGARFVGAGGAGAGVWARDFGAAATRSATAKKRIERDGRSRVALNLLGGPVFAADDAVRCSFEAAHGDLEDAAEAAQDVVAFAALAPAEPRVGAGVERTVRTSCSAIERSSKRTRRTESSIETTVAGRSVGSDGFRESDLHLRLRREIDWLGSGFAELDAGAAVGHIDGFAGDDLPSGSLTISGVTTLMRTVVRRCCSSRATAVQTPRMTTLKQHQSTFISTVPRRS